MRLIPQRTALAITLAWVLSACSLTTGQDDRVHSSTSSVDTLTVQNSETRALVLPDPTVTEAPNKTIDLNTLGANATVNVTYPAVATGHTVSVWWTGKNTYRSPVQTVGAAGPLTFTVPKANIAADVGSSGVLTYSVGVDNNPVEVSNRVSIGVVGNAVPATFPKPVAPQAQEGKLNLSTLGANVTVNVTYPTITSGHNVGLRWKGKSQYDATVQLVGTARPVVFTVPKSAVAGDVGGNGIFTYSVGIGLEPLKISEELPLSIINSASSGEATATALNTRYSDARAVCPNNTPSYYCNGVTIRATDNGNFDPWDPSPVAISKGSISYVHFKKGFRITSIFRNRHSGHILLSQDEAIAQGTQKEYLCSYAHDAWTDLAGRPANGCGLQAKANEPLIDLLTRNPELTQRLLDNEKVVEQLRNNLDPTPLLASQPRLAQLLETTPTLGPLLRANKKMLEQWASAPVLADLSTCASVNATTLTTWYTYNSTRPDNWHQCSLSTQNAAQFDVSLQARTYTAIRWYVNWNEVLIKVWPAGNPRQLPLQAFYYHDATGLGEAKIYQQKYVARTNGLWLPIIKLDMAQLNGNPFSYSQADQAVQP